MEVFFVTLMSQSVFEVDLSLGMYWLFLKFGGYDTVVSQLGRIVRGGILGKDCYSRMFEFVFYAEPPNISLYRSYFSQSILLRSLKSPSPLFNIPVGNPTT